MAKCLHPVGRQNDENLGVEDVVETIDTHEPGTITEVTKHGFKVQTGEGRLAIKSLQIPGKKRMEADAFLRGYHIETGTRLG